MTSSHRPRNSIKNNRRANDVMLRAQKHLVSTPRSNPSEVSIVINHQRPNDVMGRGRNQLQSTPIPNDSQVAIVVDGSDDDDDGEDGVCGVTYGKKINNKDRARVDVDGMIARSPYRGRSVPPHMCDPYLSPIDRGNDVTNRFFDSKANPNDTYTYYFYPANGKPPEFGANLNKTIKPKVKKKRRVQVDVTTPGEAVVDIDVNKGSGLTLGAIDALTCQWPKQMVMYAFPPTTIMEQDRKSTRLNSSHR